MLAYSSSPEYRILKLVNPLLIATEGASLDDGADDLNAIDLDGHVDLREEGIASGLSSERSVDVD